MTSKTAEKKTPGRSVGQVKPPSNGGSGGRDPRFPSDDGKGRVNEMTAERYRIGMLVSLAAILMMFIGLMSAYIVRALSPNNDWTPLATPPVMWVSTAILFVSSVTLELARRYLLIGRLQDYSRWLIVTGWLGFAFIVAQLWAWRSLAAQGIYLSSNPHSAFFYIMTALHGVHLVGGVIALGYLVIRALQEKVLGGELKARRIGAVEAARLYWHFLDILWVALFALLFFWK